jgi:steroid 5-alpha reductase family enzyme
MSMMIVTYGISKETKNSAVIDLVSLITSILISNVQYVLDYVIIIRRRRFKFVQFIKIGLVITTTLMRKRRTNTKM